jgi:hypothetical protein
MVQCIVVAADFVAADVVAADQVECVIQFQ